MGCSSSALNKAGNSSKCRSVTSNDCLPTREESQSCFAQSQPRKMGKESTFYGNVQRENLPPLEKLKTSAMSTANGVTSLPEQLQASARKDVARQVGSIGQELAEQPGTTEKSEFLEGPQESGPPQSGDKDDTIGTEGKEKDVEAMTVGQPLRMLGDESSPGTVEGTENPQTAGEIKPPETSAKMQTLETAGELQPQETVEKDDQLQIPEIVPKENESLEMLERSQCGETIEEQELQETDGNEKQSQLLETIPKENETSETLDRNQRVETAEENYSLHKTPEVPGSMERIQAEGRAGITEAEADVEMVREIHTNTEEKHIEGETGKKVETEMENETVNEGVETKEEETGEVLESSIAT